jgi:hypothetical protein
MAYSKFNSVLKFCQQFGLTQQTLQNLFQEVELPSFEISTRLLEDIAEAKTLPLLTEKAKSELIITPILKELKRKNSFITFFSGFALNIESVPELSGNPDFILSAKPNLVEIEAPIFCLMESKNKSPDEGYAQCAAEMYAARIFNQEMNNPNDIIYGAVTNGFDWVFMKLEENCLYIDSERYYLSDLNKVLSILQCIVSTSLH